MVTADVMSLYTIFPPDMGISAVSHYLNSESGWLPIQKDFVIDIFKFAATHNYFWFRGNYFLQNRGVAMGQNQYSQLWHVFSDILFLTTLCYQAYNAETLAHFT